MVEFDSCFPNLIKELAILDKYIGDNWGEINSEEFYFKTVPKVVKETSPEICKVVPEWADC
jgi:hypothetical protein